MAAAIRSDPFTEKFMPYLSNAQRKLLAPAGEDPKRAGESLPETLPKIDGLLRAQVEMLNNVV